MTASVGFINVKKHKSPHKVLNQCCDSISIHYNDRNFFVDHNTRQHYPAYNEVKCVGVRKDAHQHVINSDNSW